MKSFTELKAFRKQAYNLLCKGKDSLFDLMDAALTSRRLSSFAELSLSPLYRRQWSSLYKVLERSRPAHQALMELYCEHLPSNEQVVLAGDHSAWPRLWSKSLTERTYEHHPQASPGGKPITVGQGYSSLVCIPELSGSWVLPLLHERITSFETPLEKAAQQLEQVCQHLKHRPLSVWDSEYGCARFLSLTAHIACDKVMRLRPNRVLYAPPPALSRGWSASQTWGEVQAQATVHLVSPRPTAGDTRSPTGSAQITLLVPDAFSSGSPSARAIDIAGTTR